MKLGCASIGNRAVLAAAVENGIVDLSQCGPWETVTDLVRDWEIARPVLSQAIQTGTVLQGPTKWLAPIPHPPKFLLLAGNFRAHVVESGFAPLPEGNLTPQFFIKPDTCIIGPEDDIPLTSRNTALDHESELAVVIGRELKNGDSAQARAAVWGYTVVNDISERRLNTNLGHRQVRQNDEFFDWLTGKWFDGSAPMGPFVVTSDEIADPDALIVRAYLNDERVQEASASAMVHSIADAISYISQILTLEPGDVISMGTPAGVGMARGCFLQPNDIIECQVEGVGRIANRVAG